MARMFAAAFFWVLALWSLGAWLEAYAGLPEQLGLLAGLILAGLCIGYGLRVGLRGSASAAATGASETITAN